MRFGALACVVLALALLGGCNRDSSTGPGTAGGIVYLWIAADKDTWIWFEYPESSWGQDGYLRVADYGDHRRSFVHFHLPQLPEGTEVLEAYMELYHGGTHDDGYTDDLEIAVQRATGPWSPATLSWSNQPLFQWAPEFTIDLRSAAWSASEEVHEVVSEMFAAPDAYYGFVVAYDDPGLNHGIEKGFDSNNYNRTATDMKHAPRLLVKVDLPAGKGVGDIVLPPLPADNDLDFAPGTEILMVRYWSGATWPSSWGVVAAED